MMKKFALSDLGRFRKHAALTVLAALLILVLALTLSTFGVQAATTADGSNQVSLGLMQTSDGCIDGDVFAVVNGGDYGLAGWDVHAQFQDGSGSVYDTTTNGNGYFKFDNLPVGVYKVWIDIPAGWVLYNGMTNPRENVNVVSGACSTVLFKVEQGGTPTPGTPEPATRVDGYVYEQDCEEVTPYPGALLQLWASSVSDQLGTKLQDRYSDASGYFDFHILPDYLKDYLHLVLVTPSGMEVISTISPEGVIVAPNHIRFDFPGFESLSGNQFILQQKDLVCETPTPTPSPTVTPTATPFKLYLPIILTRPPVCEVGYIYVNVWGKPFNIPLYDVPYVYMLRPLPWGFPTTFYLREYEGDVLWTQYDPFFHKQDGGYEFTFPGGYAGEEFTLYVKTECGEVVIMTNVDDPTPTPAPEVTPQATTQPQTGWVTVADKSFDNGFLGAVERSGSPTWGIASCQASSEPNSLWPAAWGRNAAEPCAENYPDDTDSWLVLGPFDFSDATQGEVSFDYLLNTEKNHDWFGWYASEDGRSFYGVRESGHTNGWNTRTFDLNNWAGKSQVWIAFVFTSDDNGVTGDGVFLDNLTVRKFVDDGSPRIGRQRVMAPESGVVLKPSTLIRK